MSRISVVINRSGDRSGSEPTEIQTVDVKSGTQDSDKNSTIETDSAVLNKAQLLALYSVPVMPVQTINDANHNNQTASARVAMYQRQISRTRQLYMASVANRPTYLVQSLKAQFEEYQHYLMSVELDKRAVVDVDSIERLWQQLHIVDDIIEDIIRLMPAQQPVGWQITTQGRNYLRLPTVGRLREDTPVADQGSLNSYVLGHFGVMSYTYDRGYYIGHVLGYLFCCYFCAHLSIAYGVTPLSPSLIQGYDYVSLETPKMVRLLQTLDAQCKKRVYQLAVICARLSYYATDKRIEKMLIAEVNDFDKKLQQHHLDLLLKQGLMPEGNDHEHPNL